MKYKGLIILITFQVLISSCNNKIISKENLIIVKRGEPFTIELTANPSTGYSWEISIIDTNHVMFLNKNIIKNNTHEIALGKQVKEIWKFNTINKGKCKLQFNYQRNWENKKPIKTAKYTIKIK